MKKFIILISLSILLSGCNLAKITQSGLVSAGGGVVASLTGSPIAGAITAAIPAVTIEVLDPLGLNEAATLVIPENPTINQTILIIWKQLLKHSVGIIIAIGFVIIGLPMIITFILGKLSPRKKEHELKAERDLYKRMLDK